MSADSNMGFHQGIMPSILQNRHMLSFQSGSSVGSSSCVNATVGMAGPVNMGSSGPVGVSGGMFFSGSPGLVNNDVGVIGHARVTSSSNPHRDPVVGIQQDSGLSPEWTIEEQYTLKLGLIKYAGEHSTLKYIKIAAMLRRKTVRDVALRCRWLAENGKRRKLEEYYAGKRMYNRKEKMADSFLNTNKHMVNSSIAASCSLMTRQVNQTDLFTCEVPTLDSATQQLMDENSRVLHQIANNLSAYKIQENIDLFCHTRNNITAVLNNMSNMPGIISQMPPLPVTMNDQLLDPILSDSNQAFTVPWPWHSFGATVTTQQSPIGCGQFNPCNYDSRVNEPELPNSR